MKCNDISTIRELIEDVEKILVNLSDCSRQSLLDDIKNVEIILEKEKESELVGDDNIENL